MAKNLLRLKRRAQKAGVPVIYVNDNFGRWKSDFRRTVEYCARHGHGRDVVKLLRPEKSDYFVLKPKHSGFFSTTLETLRRYLKRKL
jgi:nicotinamidase-related amidase